jgi:hypothetical protein
MIAGLTDMQEVAVSSIVCALNRPLVSPKVAKLQHQNSRRGTLSVRRIKTILLGNVWLLGLGLALATSPASAQFFIIKHRPVHHPLHRPAAHASKEPFGDIPKGPLQAIISIGQQRLHFYSDGKHITDVPVATGVPGHLTPRGVFSVIQRDRYHHSNLYSNAPMPFMERITWSGVALHEGPGVGHQASHGCIRMPHDFAARLWELPTMGMRVIIAQSELQPVDIADPHLFVHKAKQPTPTAALPKPIETAQTGTGTKTDAAAPLVPPPAAAGNGAAAPPTPALRGTQTEVAKTEAAKTGAAKTGAAPDAAAAPLFSAPVGVTAAMQPGTAEPKPQQPNNTAAADTTASAKAADPAPPQMTNASSAAPADIAKAAAPANITAPIALDDVPLPLVKPERLARGDSGPIAIFVSRKAGKIFVRQNFMPVFQAPVKIDHPERPLGTHVFTALDWMPDHSTLRWNVVSLPGEAPRTVERWKYVRDIYGRPHRERVQERVVEPAQPPETADQALARIDIPQDVIDQISQLIVPGSSLVISDQGLGPETDSSGTDFIVVTR